MTLLDEPWPKDPRLAEVYDVECAGRWDHDFYLALADDLQAESIVDLGCGTGVFAVRAALRGLRVVGVDPARAILDIARTRPGGYWATWIEGDLHAVPANSADLVIMMGHVAQYFVNDDEWIETLRQIRRVLVPGGHLGFETRNPTIDWASEWTKANSEATYPHPTGGEFRSWVEVQDVVPAGDSYTITHEGNTILPDGSHLRALETLRFRTPQEVTSSLATAEFDVLATWGDWDRTAFTPTSRELIVFAAAKPGTDIGDSHVSSQLHLGHSLLGDVDAECPRGDSDLRRHVSLAADHLPKRPSDRSRQVAAKSRVGVARMDYPDRVVVVPQANHRRLLADHGDGRCRPPQAHLELHRTEDGWLVAGVGHRRHAQVDRFPDGPGSGPGRHRRDRSRAQHRIAVATVVALPLWVRVVRHLTAVQNALVARSQHL